MKSRPELEDGRKPLLGIDGQAFREDIAQTLGQVSMSAREERRDIPSFRLGAPVRQQKRTAVTEY